MFAITFDIHCQVTKLLSFIFATNTQPVQKFRITFVAIVLLASFFLGSCANSGGRKNLPKRKPLPCPIKDC